MLVYGEVGGNSVLKKIVNVISVIVLVILVVS